MKKIINIYFKKENKKIKIDIEEAVKYKLSELDIFHYNLEVIKAVCVLVRSELMGYVKSSKYWNSEKKILEFEEDSYTELSDENKLVLNNVVSSTSGIIGQSNEKSVDLYYTKCCGGGTANAEDILGYRVNYLRKVLCKHCGDCCTEKNISINEYAKKFNIYNLSYKTQIDNVFKDVKRDETGRIINLNFLGKDMTGEEFIKFFGIESNRVYFLEESVGLRIRGSGIGLGICLDGANKLADMGMNFKDIINYYYTGVDFEEGNETSNNQVLKYKKIIIDPAHGGNDVGNVKDNLVEKGINLEIALILARLLREKGADVILTRDKDEDIVLGDRVKLINKERPEFFISIHQNSFIMPGVNGVESYCYSGDDEARELASVISNEISGRVHVKNRGVRTGDYYILRESKVSGVIIECMHMSGNEDIKKYNNGIYEKIAEAIFNGICVYYDIEN